MPDALQDALLTLKQRFTNNADFKQQPCRKRNIITCITVYFDVKQEPNSVNLNKVMIKTIPSCEGLGAEVLCLCILL